MEINLPLWLAEKIGPGSLQPTSTSRQHLINGQFGNSASALFHFQSWRPIAEVFTFGGHAHVTRPTWETSKTLPWNCHLRWYSYLSGWRFDFLIIIIIIIIITIIIIIVVVVVVVVVVICTLTTMKLLPILHKDTRSYKGIAFDGHLRVRSQVHWCSVR